MPSNPVGFRASLFVLVLGLGLGLGLATLGGCASAIDAKLIVGTYDVEVTAFGKTDPDVVVASAGSDDSIVFYFTYGVTTDGDATNATGLHADIDGDSLKIKSQPIHVDYSTGTIDGMVTGTGKAGATNLVLTLKVLPSNVNFVQPDGTMVPAGGTIDYQVTGPRQM